MKQDVAGEYAMDGWMDEHLQQRVMVLSIPHIL